MVRLAVRSFGEAGADAPVAVLVHGLTSSSRTWWKVGPALADRGWRTLAVDLRSHGRSARADVPIGLEGLAADLLETISATLTEQVDVLVGHSLGALTAMTAAAVEPGCARHLVLEDPPGPLGVVWDELADGVEADAWQAENDPDAFVRRLRADNPSWGRPELDRKLQDLRDLDGLSVVAAVRAGLPIDLGTIGRAIRVPTLLVLGEEDQGSALLGPDRTTLVDALAQGTTKVLPTGHTVHSDRPEEFVDVVTTWLGASSERQGNPRAEV